MKRQESMFWPVLAMVQFAIIIVLAVMSPGLAWNWTAVGAIGSALAAISAVSIAWAQAQERRRDRVRAARAYARGLHIKLHSIVDALERFCEVLSLSDDDFISGHSKDLDLAYSLGQSIDVGKLEAIDASLVESLAKGIQLSSRASNVLGPGRGLGVYALSDASCAKVAFIKARSRLDALLKET